MSADNWTTCPKCAGYRTEKYDKAIKKAQESYGKVSSEKYLELLKETNPPKNQEPTLREDYEIGICEGEFFISYSGHCSQCDYAFNFNHNVAAV